jgi:molybdopterin-guanine dinucleotide biosynthesis protein A
MDKGLIKIYGKTLTEYATEILSPFCHEIIISSNNTQYKTFPFRIIPDIATGKGPMIGIYSALGASSTNSNLILAVDKIYITRAFFKYLLARDLSEFHAAVPYIQNKYFEPLVGYYSAKCLPLMEQMMQVNNYKLPDLLSKIPVVKLMVEGDFPEFKPDYFQSLNHPDDLARLKEMRSGR